jgi:creatinine amidohydrolase
MKTRNWADLAWTDFASLPANTVAILPVGAIEQHGPHLPLSVDADINAGILRAALDLLPSSVPALALPMTSVGISVEHGKFPGSLTMSPETALALWGEIGAAVARAGVRRLLILNSHGGQPQVVEIVCRRMRIKHRMLAVGAMWGRIRPTKVALPATEARHGIHAGLVETALMLALRPDTVRAEKITDATSRAVGLENTAPTLAGLGYAALGWMAQDLGPTGAVGDARGATAELGRALLDDAARAVADLITDMAALDLDTWLRDSPA